MEKTLKEEMADLLRLAQEKQIKFAGKCKVMISTYADDSSFYVTVFDKHGDENQGYGIYQVRDIEENKRLLHQCFERIYLQAKL